MKPEKLELNLGQGYNPLKKGDKAIGRLVVGSKSDPEYKGNIDTTSHEMETRLAVVDTHQALSQLVDASGGVSIPSVESELEASSHLDESHHTINLALFAYLITSKTSLNSDYELNESIAGLPTEADSAEESMNKLYSMGGTGFVRQIERGRAIAAVITIKEETKKHNRSLKSQLQTEVSGLKGHAAIQYLTNNLGKLNVIKIRVNGVGVGLPSAYTNSEEFVVIINTLAELIGKATGEGRLSIHFAPYLVAFPEAKNFFAREYEEKVTRFETLYVDTRALADQVSSVIEFYNAFDQSHYNYHKKDDDFFTRLSAATAELRKINRELKLKLREYSQLVTLSKLNLEKETESFKKTEESFYKQLDEMPELSRFTLIKTVNITYKPWELLKPHGVRRRVCEEPFSLNFPPGTDHLMFSINQFEYADEQTPLSTASSVTTHQPAATAGDDIISTHDIGSGVTIPASPKKAPLTKIQLDLKRKNRGWHTIVKKNVIKGREETIWDLCDLKLLEEGGAFYFATSEDFNPHPTQGPLTLQIKIYAGNSHLLMDTPFELHAGPRSAAASPKFDFGQSAVDRIPHPGLGTGPTITLPPTFATSGLTADHRNQIMHTPLMGHHHNSQPHHMSGDVIKPRSTSSAPASLPATPARSRSVNSNDTVEASARSHSSLGEVSTPVNTPPLQQPPALAATTATESARVSPALVKMLDQSSKLTPDTLPVQPLNKFPSIAKPPARSAQFSSAFTPVTAPLPHKASPHSGATPTAPHQPIVQLKPDEQPRTPSL